LIAKVARSFVHGGNVIRLVALIQMSQSCEQPFDDPIHLTGRAWSMGTCR